MGMTETRPLNQSPTHLSAATHLHLIINRLPVKHVSHHASSNYQQHFLSTTSNGPVTPLTFTIIKGTTSPPMTNINTSPPMMNSPTPPFHMSSSAVTNSTASDLMRSRFDFLVPLSLYHSPGSMSDFNDL
ncbi:hypothetical protein CMV_024447 [Castanea mollissima]|uniref:Uncharacterized protein n=1 Tax=Castanea mollissima TaxID=60419 RepID=A0A8J4QEU3_9ROSI|nr:hypothetical protein CMV_024447 [Castanea mollissima]